MTTNVFISDHPEEAISQLLATIGQPARIQILFAIGTQEACVCHLEAALGMRQASISQHLMVLRKAGLVTPHRDGRNIFYRLSQPAVLEVLTQVACLSGLDPAALLLLSTRPAKNCLCPYCNPDLDPQLTCPKKQAGRSASSETQESME